MNLQENILSIYKNQFPTDTIRKVSDRTGIQVTRIFRLFNGHDMKISELEAFQKATNQTSEPILNEFYKLTQKSANTLEHRHLKILVHKMQDLIEFHELKNNSMIDICINKIS